MTMDIASEQQIDLKSHLEDSHLQIKQISDVQTKIPIKRSFDVAFLMLPDEKLKQKEKNLRQAEISYPLTELSVRSDLINRHHQLSKINNKVFINGDYAAVFKPSSEDRYSSGSLNSTASSEKSDDTIESEIPRSAFSKVTQIINVDSPIPPAISPDQLSCSSASPPISYSPPTANFRHDYSQLINSSAFQAINQPSFSPQKHQKVNFQRGNQIHSQNNNNNGEQGYNIHAFHPHTAAFMSQPEQFIRNPAAAILSTFLPNTIGSLALPAQNVCAKCNISFRMTSDLVYHMRSHHKNENCQDPCRRKREEKLKCPVCSESFRERHHLTRHMTAHQDKEGDLLDHEIAEYHSRRK